jgi:hypothetical protein
VAHVYNHLYGMRSLEEQHRALGQSSAAHDSFDTTSRARDKPESGKSPCEP